MDEYMDEYMDGWACVCVLSCKEEYGFRFRNSGRVYCGILGISIGVDLC